MRNFVVGLVIGLLIAFSLPAYGETDSMIGKKVTNEYPVVVDGERLPVDAIAIDGTSYAPLRVIGKVTGYNVSFQNKTVVFAKIPDPEEQNGSVAEEGEPVKTEIILPEPEYSLENIDEAIRLKEEAIQSHMSLVEFAESRNGPSEITQKHREAIEKMKQELEELKQIKAELEAQQ